MLASQRARRFGALALSSALLFSLATPASAATTKRDPDISRRKQFERIANANRPAGAVHYESGTVVAEEPATSKSPSDYIDAAGDMRDPKVYASAVRAMTEDAWGISLPDPREQQAAANPDDDIMLGLPAGDLTGDGLADALSLEYRWDDWDVEYSVLRALRGTDGAELWSVPIDGAYDTWPIQVGDLTGDGNDDVLLARLDVEFARQGACAVIACALPGDATFTWTYSLISGSSGDIAWRNTYDGELTQVLTRAGVLVGFTYAYAYRATNLAVVPRLSADHDQDGSPDLAFNSYDVTGLWGVQFAGYYGYAYAYEYYTLVTTRGDLVSGADGTSRSIRTQENAPGGAALLPAGNAVGDSSGDLLWAAPTDLHSPVACVIAVVVGRCAQVAARNFDLEMLDGTDLSTAWTSKISDAPADALTAAGSDLTGDGRADMITTATDATFQSSVAVISGADGSVSWKGPIDGNVTVVGAIGGEPGSDLIDADASYDYDASTAATSIRRLDGATGVELSKSDRTFDMDPDGWTDVWLYLAGDTDADGVIDIGIDLNNYGWETNTTHSIVESGATGEVLLDRNVSGYGALLPGGDMDADGTMDLLALDASYVDDGYDVTSSGISVPTGTLWTLTQEFAPCFYLWVSFTGDQSGQGGDDQVQSRAQCFDDGIESRMDGFEQSTGSFTWGVGDALTTRASLGAISGTVTDEDGDPMSACIDVLVPEEDGWYWYVGSTRSAEDGSYRVGGLGTGGYIVDFFDCDNWQLAEEYYNDQAQIQDADMVPVVVGNETTGIDAQLTMPGSSGGAEPPPNDNFVDAVAISSAESASADTRGATLEVGEPGSPCAPVGRTVWYSYTPTTPGVATLSTAGSNFDTVVSVFVGGDLGSLEHVTCNDDTRTTESLVVFPVTAGETYWIQAGGFFNESGDLAVALT